MCLSRKSWGWKKSLFQKETFQRRTFFALTPPNSGHKEKRPNIRIKYTSGNCTLMTKAAPAWGLLRCHCCRLHVGPLRLNLPAPLRWSIPDFWSFLLNLYSNHRRETITWELKPTLECESTFLPTMVMQTPREYKSCLNLTPSLLCLSCKCFPSKRFRLLYFLLLCEYLSCCAVNPARVVHKSKKHTVSLNISVASDENHLYTHLLNVYKAILPMGMLTVCHNASTENPNFSLLHINPLGSRAFLGKW